MRDPLLRGVHPGAIKVLSAGAAVAAVEEGARSNVNQLDLQRAPVNQDVLVLYIPVDNSSLVTAQYSLDCLME